MTFNSLAYLVFLPIVYALYQLLGRRGQNLLLLAASYYFYGCWDVRFLFLIAVSTGIDYYCGLMMGEGRVSRAKRHGLPMSVTPEPIPTIRMGDLMRASEPGEEGEVEAPEEAEVEQEEEALPDA